MALAPPPRSEKPRSAGITAMIDFGPDQMGWTGEHGLRDLMACAAPFIDMAKIYALNAILMPEDAVKANVAVYRDNDVTPYTGGVLFEYAWLRGEVDDMLDHVERLGVPALEISENYVILEPDARHDVIARAAGRGFEVVWEFGRKNPDGPFDLDQFAGEHIGIGAQEFRLDFASIQRAPQERSHRSYLLAAQAAGLDRRKVAQVGSHIQGQTVRRDPVPHVDADRRHLGRANPSARQAAPSRSLQTIGSQRADQHGLQIAQVLMYVSTALTQIDDRIGHDLARPVKRHAAPAVNLDHI